MKIIKKVISIMMLCTMCTCVLVGCGSSSSEQKTSGITIGDSLSVDSVIVKAFDETQYDVAELKSMMDSEAADYNSLNGAGKVTAGDAVVNNGFVEAHMSYATAEDYAAFNSRCLKISSLDAALSDGSVSVALKDIKNDTIVNPTTIEDTESLYLVITDEVGLVTCPGNVIYISDGVEPASKKAATVTDNMDGLAYIIFKLK